MRPLLLLLAVTACATTDTTKADPEDSDSEVVDTDPAGDTDGVDSDARDTDEADGTDTDDDTDVGDTDVTTPAADPVRFIALGDAGEGNTDQYTVAQAIADVCLVKGCDFALYLGDNFYDDGVQSTDDDQFETKFELPYADLDFPFYAVLGNHDYGSVPVLFWQVDYQVDYTQFSTKWRMPDKYYDFGTPDAHFIGLDTNAIMLGLDLTNSQRPWVRSVMNANAHKTWRIAYGHHPWRSNGRHGNVGNYEGLGWVPLTEVANGAYLKQFFRGQFCDKLDIYLSGHDHNRQWLDPACGVHIFVSGAGAKTTDFEHRDNNPTVWDDDTEEGFIWFELDGNTASIEIYDLHGNLDYSGVIQK